VLGKVYAVVTKRRGRITNGEVREGSPFFTVSATLPVLNSFGFADEIRKRTSGAASPQLIFAGFEVLEEDPFWVPMTEEELEDWGEGGGGVNVARGYVDAIRGRKGLFVEKKILRGAEKQKTLKR
jgi:ribosome assembly protein 1